VSDDLAGRATGAFMDRDARKGQKPSDHAPVVVDMADA
jgi:exonuclease III